MKMESEKHRYVGIFTVFVVSLLYPQQKDILPFSDVLTPRDSGETFQQPKVTNALLGLPENAEIEHQTCGLDRTCMQWHLSLLYKIKKEDGKDDCNFAVYRKSAQAPEDQAWTKNNLK